MGIRDQGLDPEVVEAAKERGRERDPQVTVEELLVEFGGELEEAFS